MAKHGTQEKDMEAKILDDLAGGKDASEIETDMTDRDNFNIVKNMPMPAGFVNPPCGEEGHLCVDRGGKYQPGWYQLLIERMHEHQEDPQTFPLGVTLTVALEVWTDVPPEIIESLKSAVEEHHSMNATTAQVALSQHPEQTSFKKKRFVYHVMTSE